MSVHGYAERQILLDELHLDPPLRLVQEDGTWYNRTRALAFQPYFDSGFPHGYSQWMSAAATSWAAMALTLALPEADQLAAANLSAHPSSAN